MTKEQVVAAINEIQAGKEIKASELRNVFFAILSYVEELEKQVKKQNSQN